MTIKDPSSRYDPRSGVHTVIVGDDVLRSVGPCEPEEGSA